MSETALLKRTIVFHRMNSKIVDSYKIYTIFQDDTYSIGFRQELLDEIKNPDIPDVKVAKIPLEYNENLTWKSPNDIYMDIDHPFHLYINGFIVSPLMYEYNRITKLITINSKLLKVEQDATIELEYFRDIITKTYLLDDDCKIKVVPVYKKEAQIGKHNVII